jgi:ribosome recycling factor
MLYNCFMNPSQVVSETKTKLTQATEHFKLEIGKIRTGRAHPGMLDSVSVEVYGQTMPLKAVAGITAPEAQLLQISPFDPTNLQAISDSIRNNPSLGLNPADDGRVVRIQIPPLTQETRQAMVKILNQKVEETMITARQLRHEALHQGNQAEKNKLIGKDERLRFEKQIDEQLADQKAQIEALQAAKEKEISTI